MCQHVKVLEKLNEDVNVFLRAIYLSIYVLEKKHLTNRKNSNNERKLGRNHVGIYCVLSKNDQKPTYLGRTLNSKSRSFLFTQV